MAHHSNYWSCSPFADWLRGTAKISVGTSEEWETWDDLAKKKHPIRYWIAEQGLDYIQDFVTFPLRTIYGIKYYINNRWVTRTHSLTAHPRDIKPGVWTDVGDRFLPCLFNELVDYVEMELAWWHIAWDGAARKKYQAPFWASGWWRVRTWRCRQAGIDNLKWQMSLTKDTESWGLEKDDKEYGEPTPQALGAKEILDLYTWWTEIYPNRPDPHEASGWSEYCEKKRELNDGKLFGSKETPELKRMSKKAILMLDKIERSYDKEDTDMLIRLIKIRDRLWT